MDYEKKYNEALEQAKGYMDAGSSDLTDVLPEIFPELRESENERMLKKLIEGFENYIRDIRYFNDIDVLDILNFLEKQKEQKLVMIQWTGKNLKEVIDFTGKSPWFDEWFKSWKEFENYVHSHDDILKLFCEDGSHYEVPVGAWIVKTPDGYNTPSRFRFIQKPASTEDMPYITDEHFYEREQVDSFKYKLAEYMTKCCTKKEGPYGYEYGISSETILEMAKEELIKRGVVVEREQCCIGIKGDPDPAGVWKPTEDQMKAIDFARRVLFETYPSQHNGCEPYHILGELYEQLNKL